MMIRWSWATAVVFASVALGGCSVTVESSEPPPSTPGDSGTLRFQYGDAGCGIFLNACPLDQPFLTGSEGDVAIVDGPSSGHVTFTFEGSVASVTGQREYAHCVDAKSTTRDVDLDMPCAPGETKEAFRHVTLLGNAPGEGKVVVRDAKTGKEIDRVTVRVASASDMRIEVSKRGPAEKDYSGVVPDGDVYRVRVSDKVRVRAEPLDAAKKPIRVGRHGVAHEYADRAVLAPSTDVGEAILGSSDAESIVAKQSGETSLVVKTAGASRALQFRVVRP